MLWYDMLLYDMVWFDTVWYDTIWADMIWYDLILFSEQLEQITGKWIHPTTSFLILKLPSLHIGLAFPRSCLCTRSLSSPEWFPNVVEIIAKIPHCGFCKVICVYQVCLLRCGMNLFFWLKFQSSWRKCIVFLARNQSFRFIMVYGIMGPWDPEFSQSVCTQKWHGLFSWKRILCFWTCLHPWRWTCCTSFPWRWKGSDPFSTFLFITVPWLVSVNFSHIHLPGVHFFLPSLRR